LTSEHGAQSLDVLTFCLHSLPWWSYSVSRMISPKTIISSPNFWTPDSYIQLPPSSLRRPTVQTLHV
jgi:hypothetical protein